MAQIVPGERSRHRPRPAQAAQGGGRLATGPGAARLAGLQRLADDSAGVAELRSLGDTAQRAAPEEELPAQGRFRGTAQRAAPEEELPAQGRFRGTAQRAQEEDMLQGKFDTPAQRAQEEDMLQGRFRDTAQRVEEEEMLQGRFETPAQREAAGGQTSAAGGGGLPGPLRAGIEQLSGVSMDGVQVHYNSSKPAQLNAHAYAQGTDIHLAPGQEKHLPHEAWHVVQQAEGRVDPTLDIAGTPVNDSAALEHEADVMGARAARG